MDLRRTLLPLDRLGTAAKVDSGAFVLPAARCELQARRPDLSTKHRGQYHAVLD